MMKRPTEKPKPKAKKKFYGSKEFINSINKRKKALDDVTGKSTKRKTKRKVAKKNPARRRTRKT